ncbi:predicted protein [Uncinocarpus reesii 1704]|uniref:Uncharacterized protein n=1 Tax=Uncinocarpus reesii (strain UAMH 1704) TaxID=336963 RepID=C4JEY4_UNCRE|nr:uncharacterized protein UREG_00884 [Uncinocarpus reesii 1704]EEP76037.1 predicted protein [Uncinocarpus reesii 1704]
MLPFALAEWFHMMLMNIMQCNAWPNHPGHACQGIGDRALRRELGPWALPTSRPWGGSILSQAMGRWNRPMPDHQTQAPMPMRLFAAEYRVSTCTVSATSPTTHHDRRMLLVVDIFPAVAISQYRIGIRTSRDCSPAGGTLASTHICYRSVKAPNHTTYATLEYRYRVPPGCLVISTVIIAGESSYPCKYLRTIWKILCVKSPLPQCASTPHALRSSRMARAGQILSIFSVNATRWSNIITRSCRRTKGKRQETISSPMIAVPKQPRLGENVDWCSSPRSAVDPPFIYPSCAAQANATLEGTVQITTRQRPVVSSVLVGLNRTFLEVAVTSSAWGWIRLLPLNPADGG